MQCFAHFSLFCASNLRVMKKNIAIFASGSGSNAENIIRYFQKNDSVQVSLVLSNKSDAYVLERAHRLGVPCNVFPKEDWIAGDEILAILQEYRIDFVVLAGFLVGENGKVDIDPDTVQIAYDMFDYFEAHNSKRGTLLYLIDKYNRYFCYETIARALRNPLYKGEYRGNSDYCPKIIDPARFDRIQVLGKRNVKVRKNNRYYVFSGLAQNSVQH